MQGEKVRVGGAVRALMPEAPGASSRILDRDHEISPKGRKKLILSTSRAKNREEHHCESVLSPNLPKLNEILDFYRFLQIFWRFPQFSFFSFFLSSKRRTKLKI